METTAAGRRLDTPSEAHLSDGAKSSDHSVAENLRTGTPGRSTTANASESGLFADDRPKESAGAASATLEQNLRAGASDVSHSGDVVAKEPAEKGLTVHTSISDVNHFQMNGMRTAGQRNSLPITRSEAIPLEGASTNVLGTAISAVNQSESLSHASPGRAQPTETVHATAIRAAEGSRAAGRVNRGTNVRTSSRIEVVGELEVTNVTSVREFLDLLEDETRPIALEMENVELRVGRSQMVRLGQAVPQLREHLRRTLQHEEEHIPAAVPITAAAGVDHAQAAASTSLHSRGGRPQNSNIVLRGRVMGSRTTTLARVVRAAAAASGNTRTRLLERTSTVSALPATATNERDLSGDAVVGGAESTDCLRAPAAEVGQTSAAALLGTREAAATTTTTPSYMEQILEVQSQVRNLLAEEGLGSITAAATKKKGIADDSEARGESRTPLNSFSGGGSSSIEKLSRAAQSCSTSSSSRGADSFRGIPVSKDSHYTSGEGRLSQSLTKTDSASRKTARERIRRGSGSKGVSQQDEEAIRAVPEKKLATQATELERAQLEAECGDPLNEKELHDSDEAAEKLLKAEVLKNRRESLDESRSERIQKKTQHGEARKERLNTVHTIAGKKTGKKQHVGEAFREEEGKIQEQEERMEEQHQTAPTIGAEKSETKGKHGTTDKAARMNGKPKESMHRLDTQPVSQKSYPILSDAVISRIVYGEKTATECRERENVVDSLQSAVSGERQKRSEEVSDSKQLNQNDEKPRMKDIGGQGGQRLICKSDLHEGKQRKETGERKGAEDQVNKKVLGGVEEKETDNTLVSMAVASMQIARKSLPEATGTTEESQSNERPGTSSSIDRETTGRKYACSEQAVERAVIHSLREEGGAIEKSMLEPSMEMTEKSGHDLGEHEEKRADERDTIEILGKATSASEAIPPLAESNLLQSLGSFFSWRNFGEAATTKAAAKRKGAKKNPTPALSSQKIDLQGLEKEETLAALEIGTKAGEGESDNTLAKNTQPQITKIENAGYRELGTAKVSEGNEGVTAQIPERAADVEREMPTMSTGLRSGDDSKQAMSVPLLCDENAHRKEENIFVMKLENEGETSTMDNLKETRRRKDDEVEKSAEMQETDRSNRDKVLNILERDREGSDVDRERIASVAVAVSSVQGDPNALETKSTKASGFSKARPTLRPKMAPTSVVAMARKEKGT